MPLPAQVPPLGVPLRLIGAASIHRAKALPALTIGSGWTRISSVSRVRQLPAPKVYTSSNVPAEVGSKMPPEVTPGPVQVPPEGVGLRARLAASTHKAASFPAFAGVASITVTFFVSCAEQPFAFVKA